MKRLVFVLLALALATCAKETPQIAEVTDTRASIAVMYVAVPEMVVREKPDDNAPVVTKYPIGDAVSVLTNQGAWIEIRSGERSGWVHAADLQTAQAQKSGEDNPEPKFSRMPLPISAPSAHGEIYIEASVNTDGDVTDSRIITNTTGSETLARQNEASLRAAKFYPITIKGVRKPFKYYHRVTY